MESRPEEAAFHGNVAEAYRVLGKLDEAQNHAATAVRLEPGSAIFHNTLGLVLAARLEHTAAIDHFRAAVQLDPQFALAHNNLGLSLRALHRDEEALACLREAIRRDPSLPQPHNNLGQMLLERHQPEEALSHCREALRLRPGSPEALNNLGNVLRELGRLDEATACYRQALEARPDQAMTHQNLGKALQEEGRLDEALACYHKAVLLERDSAPFLCSLAGGLKEKEQNAVALALCRRALELEPEYLEAQQLHAWLLEEEGDVAAALAGYRAVLRLKPDRVEAHVALGHLLSVQGEMDQAEAAFRQALNHDPANAAAYASLATALRGNLPDGDLKELYRLLGLGLSPPREVAVRHGLAHVLDARGQHLEAAEHLSRGNALKLQLLRRQGNEYDPAAHDQFVANIMEAFDPAFFERTRDWGLETEVPVFIIGLPRSGTTLTEQILASHPQASGAGELRLARETFELLPRLSQPDAAPESRITSVGRYTPKAITRAAELYLERLLPFGPEAARIVDKMPDNYLYLGLIAALFPRARIIHTTRDVRDTALSCWMTNFQQIHWACDPGHIVSRVRAYQRLMDHWRCVLPVPVLEVAYEDTVADLEGTARRLVAWCGLEWDAACLAFHKTRRPIRTASVTQVRQPIYKSSVQRWKNYAAPLADLWQQLA